MCAQGSRCAHARARAQRSMSVQARMCGQGNMCAAISSPNNKACHMGITCHMDIIFMQASLSHNLGMLGGACACIGSMCVATTSPGSRAAMQAS